MPNRIDCSSLPEFTCDTLVAHTEGRAQVCPSVVDNDDFHTPDVIVTHVIGKGAFSTVFGAYVNHDQWPAATAATAATAEPQTPTRLLVALKVFKSHRRFWKCAIAEAEFLDRFGSDDYVVGFYGAARFKYHIALALEVATGDLYTYQRNCFDNPSMTADAMYPVVDLIEHLFSGLTALAREEVVHCDLKPENILLVMRNGRRVAVVGDLGSSRSTLETDSDGGVGVSPWYRAPEVYARGTLCSAGDVWSAACVVYEYAYGAPLFPVTRERWAGTTRESTALYFAHLELIGYHGDCFSVDTDAVFAPPDIRTNTLLPRNRVELTAARTNIQKHPGLCGVLTSCLKWDTDERATPLAVLDLARHIGEGDTVLLPTSSRPAPL